MRQLSPTILRRALHGARSLRVGSWALALLVPLGVPAKPLRAATTTYASAYAGGTIAPGDTVQLNNGATVTGNVVANGTLRFNQATTTLTIASNIYGTGTLSLTNTGTVNLKAPSIAGEFDLTITATSGLLQIRSGTGDLVMGRLSAGALRMTGGSVANSNATLGKYPGSSGLALVQSGTWTSSGFLTIGESGTGDLFVTGGLASGRFGVLGFNATGLGTATVSRGTWANSDELSVGYFGTGTLNVTGGRVTTGKGTLGDFASGVGTAAVSSGTWEMSDRLSVGFYGAGTLNLSGGRVTNADGFIGSEPGSNGTATITGGTWATSGDLAVGAFGTGMLTMTGGLVSVAGSLSKGASGTINLDSGGRLQIGTGGATGVLLGGTGSLVNDGTLIFNRADASTHSGVLSGAGALTKQGGGTLTLSGSNSFTGGTTISGGTLQVGGGGTEGSIVGNVVNNSALAFNRSDAVTYSGTVSGTGSLTKQGAGTLTLLGNNSSTGGTTISGGTLQVGGGGTEGSIAGSVVNNSALVFNRSDPVTYAGTLSGTGSLAKQGAGALTLSGSNSFTGGTTISGGTLQVGTGGTTGSIAGNVVNNSALVFNRSDAVTYSGALSGPGSLTKQGGGTLTLSGSNSHTGGTTISGGTLQVGAGGTTGSIAGNVVNNSALVFNRSDAVTFSGTLSGTGSIRNAGTGTTTLTGRTSFTDEIAATAGRLIAGNSASVNGFSTTGSLLAASGATLELVSRGLASVNGLSTLTGGTLRAANGISLGAGANVVGAGAISGLVSASYGSRIEADGGKLTVGDSSSYVGFASAGLLYTNTNEVEFLDRNVAVLGSLTQVGDGAAGGTLRAANGMLLEQGKNLVGRGTVYGNFINQGDVYGDGSAVGQRIVFAAGSTVSGIGSFENVVFDGTYSPGNSPAITNLSGGRFSSSSSLLIELGGTQPGTQYDRVVDSGALSLLGGTLDVVLYNGFVPSYGDSFEILQYGQLSGDFGAVNYPALSGTLSWERTTSATAMTITVVPEPAMYAITTLATAGVAGLVRWRRRGPPTD
ncbi:MAG: beta strand repeat-containing protein [Planctomycetaceae bacterium]